MSTSSECGHTPWSIDVTEEAKRVISLEKLGERVPILLDEMVGFYRLNCMVCLDFNNHTSGVTLTVHYDKREYPFQITWDGTVTYLGWHCNR